MTKLSQPDLFLVSYITFLRGVLQERRAIRVLGGYRPSLFVCLLGFLIALFEALLLTLAESFSARST